MATFNIMDTVQSQYAASPRMIALVTGFAGFITPAAGIDLLFKKYFNVDTAEGVGLDNLGRIIGLPRTVNSITMNDALYRTFLKIKMAANISGSTLRDLNVILNKIFKDRGLCYVREAGLMEIRYEFFFKLTDIEKELLKSELVMPRPGGVGFGTAVIIVKNKIGFDGQKLSNFFQSNFGV